METVWLNHKNAPKDATPEKPAAAGRTFSLALFDAWF
jgi:hypothetical protein